MTTTTLETSPTTVSPRHRSAGAQRTIAPIPTTRLVGVELRKMFDTRAGFWLVAGIVIAATVASGSVIAFAPDQLISYSTFASALGIPMSVLLPVIAVLCVTSEYSQRTGLTTYTLVPHRGRVVAAKLAATVLMGVVAVVVALGIGALGNLLGASLVGIDPVWDVDAAGVAMVLLALTMTMLVGFMLGVLIRSSAPAIVAFLVWTAVLPALSNTLAAFQSWYADAMPWVDFNSRVTALYDAVPHAEGWAQLGVTGLIWLVVPTLIGLRFLMRAEVK